MGLPSQGSDSNIMFDAFLAFRQMMNYLDDLVMVIDANTSRVRVSLEASSATISISGTLTNITNIGGVAANELIFDNMDIVFNTAIRPQII